MIDENKLIQCLEILKGKCWDRAKKENNKNFARKALNISQIIGIINIQPKIGEWISCSDRLPTMEECPEASHEPSPTEKNVNILKEYANMPKVEINGNNYVDKELFISLLDKRFVEERKDCGSVEERNAIDICRIIIANF